MTAQPPMPAGAQPGPGGASGRVPAWLRRTEGEQRWWAAGCVLLAIGLQALLPDRFSLHPRYLAQAILAGLLILQVVTSPTKLPESSNRVRRTAQGVVALVAASNAVSLVLLVRQITAGGHLPAVELLLGGAEIWFTNTIIFALAYWDFDRGGPASRAAGIKHVPDLLFPQMTDDSLDPDWEPIFFDYLFVSYTNSTAFSPTDTLPLSRWVKFMFMCQSAVSLITVALVAARAVNILPGS